jgi:hypothetical protein
MKKLSVLVLYVAVFISCNGEKKLNEYGYVFQESTAQNQYLIMDGRRVPIKNLVADGSNRVALKSLQALKWTVLYLKTLAGMNGLHSFSQSFESRLICSSDNLLRFDFETLRDKV